MRYLIKNLVLSSPLTKGVYGYIHEKHFENDYRSRRENYESLSSSPLSYQTEAATYRARQKIVGRGYTPLARSIGEVHTFAFIPSNWSHQNQIASALKKVGPCTRFDYVDAGFALASLRSVNPNSFASRKEMLSIMLKKLGEVHREHPVDWFFSYALGWDMTVDTIRKIQDEYGIPTVNISLDDKNWWEEIERGDKLSGLKNIIPFYDLGWTSASSVVSWYWAEGGQAIFLPEGVNTEWFRPFEIERDIMVGFVGDNFGYRNNIVGALRKAKIPVEVRGAGWPGGRLSDEKMLKFFNRCHINLGIGDMHYSRWLTNLKGRDFEVPSTGRGLYITTYNSDLAKSFEIGKEIECYRGIDEAIELIRHYLRNPEEASIMAKRSREKCIKSHQWHHRFEVILKSLGIIGT